MEPGAYELFRWTEAEKPIGHADDQSYRRRVRSGNGGDPARQFQTKKIVSNQLQELASQQSCLGKHLGSKTPPSDPTKGPRIFAGTEREASALACLAIR